MTSGWRRAPSIRRTVTSSTAGIPKALEREVDLCIRRGVVCDLASNREEDGPFFAE